MWNEETKLHPFGFRCSGPEERQEGLIAFETDKAGLQILEVTLTGCVTFGKLQYFSLPQLMRQKNGITATNSRC